MARNDGEASRFEKDWHACQWPDFHQPPKLHTHGGGRPGRIPAFLAVLDRPQAGHDGRVTTVVLPEWEPRHLVQSILERPGVAFFKLALVRRPDVVAASVPSDGKKPEAGPQADHIAIVPIADLDAPVRRALTYAAAVASEVIAVHVETRADEPADETPAIARRLRGWKHEPGTGKREAPVKLTVIESPYRSIIPPVLAYVDSWRKAHPEPTCTVVLPELVTDRWWAHWLHNHRAFWLKAALLSRPTIAVADVTYHLQRPGTASP